MVIVSGNAGRISPSVYSMAAAGGSGSVQALMGHLVWSMVTILHGVGGTPEEVRWLISKYNLKRIKKIYVCLLINVQA